MFFAEFLATTGVFDRWVSSCPLSYRCGNAPDKRDVLGTLMLAMLAGHKRYAHITALRGDAVAAQALGMDRVVSEDALRRAMERLDEAASTAWMRPSLMHSVREALERPWVLDIDASIKPLYGRQEGAEIGYNPTKPCLHQGQLGADEHPCVVLGARALHAALQRRDGLGQAAQSQQGAAMLVQGEGVAVASVRSLIALKTNGPRRWRKSVLWIERVGARGTASAGRQDRGPHRADQPISMQRADTNRLPSTSACRFAGAGNRVAGSASV
ncbi:MAG: hypothetical protein ACRC2B_04520 [Rubrivivax sp.]